MVYIEVWDQYQEEVEKLYLGAPFKTRYVSKYRHTDGKLVLKVTNGPKFRTERMQDLRKFERLNLSLMQKMQAKKLPEPMDIDPISTSAAPPAASQNSSNTGKKGKSKKKR
ncbi:signal recognition particle, SRP9/SRP14 subunit [Phlyctochytrium arcticum]|nr:signal recognition particle, SRP9/SRP14 subunit [Phlyctochytrium arcticum]